MYLQTIIANSNGTDFTIVTEVTQPYSIELDQRYPLFLFPLLTV